MYTLLSFLAETSCSKLNPLSLVRPFIPRPSSALPFEISPLVSMLLRITAVQTNLVAAMQDTECVRNRFTLLRWKDECEYIHKWTTISGAWEFTSPKLAWEAISEHLLSKKISWQGKHAPRPPSLACLCLHTYISYTHVTCYQVVLT